MTLTTTSPEEPEHNKIPGGDRVASPVLDIRADLAAISAAYDADPTQQTTNFMLVGKAGCGKTHLLRTFPGPILIDSFDPQGTIGLASDIRSGRIVADTRWEAQTPDLYARWEMEFHARRRKNLFAGLGAYVIDSGTMWHEAVKNYVLLKHDTAKKKGSDGLTQQGYAIANEMTKKALMLLTNLPCMFVFTAHTEPVFDDEGRQIDTTIAFNRALKTLIPRLFSEIYYLDCLGGQYRLHMQPNVDKVARSRLLATMSPEAAAQIGTHPDIRQVLSAAGRDWRDLADRV